MARVDKLSDSGRVRANAASGLDAQAGLWGDLDLLCVLFDASGELALASETDCDGVILTTEGRKDPDYSGYKDVIGGKTYTVMSIAELTEMEVGTSPALSAGDDVYADAGGDVTTSPIEGAIFLGTVLDSGSRMRLNVGGRVPAGLTGDLVSPLEIKTAVVAGGVAGNITVTGIATEDTLVSVIRFTGGGVDVTDVEDLTSEFTITAADTINNTGGTNTTGDKLLVIYVDKSL